MQNSGSNKSQQNNILLDVFARIWALWGILSFVTTFLIVLIPSLLTALIPDPKGMYYFIKIAKGWMIVWLNLIGCPVSTKGEENFAEGETYIVTCNHNSLLDIPLSSPFIPGANQTIAKKEFLKVPLFGWYYNRGSVIVDRNSDASRRKSFELMKEALAMGFHMCIYPEGTRNKSELPIKKFYDGAFKLAESTGNAIIPAVILHTKKALPIHRFFYLVPHRLAIHFLAPVITKDRKAEEVKQEVFEIMTNYYVANN